MTVLKVAVIGTGFGRKVAAPAFAGVPDAEVVDVVSARDHGAVSAVCSRRDLDLVSIHSPPFLHREHVELAVGHGVGAVLCEKPMGTSVQDATRMLSVVEAAGTLHFVNFEFRFLPARRELAEIVSSGDIGDPVQLVWTHFSSGTARPRRPVGWLFDPALGGGWVGAWASHAVDTVRWLLGEVRDTTAVLGTLIGERPDASGALRPVDAEDSVSAVLTTERDQLAVFASSFAAPAASEPRILVVGTRGLVECVGDRQVVVRRADGTVREWQAPEGERHMQAMAAWAQVVCGAVASGHQQGPSFSDGLACDRVLEAMRHSARLRWPAA